MTQFSTNASGQMTKQSRDAESWMDFCVENFHRDRYIGSGTFQMESRKRPKKTNHFRGRLSKESVRSVINIRAMYYDWASNQTDRVYINVNEAKFMFNLLLDDWDEMGLDWRSMLESSPDPRKTVKAYSDE